eukprot:CAMPEP_0177295056 /NCGR_PEP_ID=MMETSP0368-20130122/1657_1 /TAXON_ID=447022 ORGANISM="Scrippsiella hangoei-like, Strain SHHI-4" /NCGR_SAMPLE_ID=MMETSP0368 /ASSEMBLY_ACC=CAM_ASM_000363 /LENGTH=69 /DNA_ID=CAMNT_0018753033 /DNA_START=632 /DNA_END=837 /DNA_ORIENTATION=-
MATCTKNDKTTITSIELSDQQLCNDEVLPSSVFCIRNVSVLSPPTTQTPDVVAVFYRIESYEFNEVHPT